MVEEEHVASLAPSLRTSLLLVLLLTSLAPLALLAYWDGARVEEARAAAERAGFENAALAAAIRADAASTRGDDALASAGEAVAPAWRVYLLTREGRWSAQDGTSGDAPELAATIGDRLSGVIETNDPATGAPGELAWARAPAVDALVVLSRPPATPASGTTFGFALVLATIAAGAVVMAVSLSARVLRPVRRLERASARLAEGHWDERVVERGGREVASLAHSFNRMATDLAQQHHRLEAYARELDDLVQDRTRSLVESRLDLDAMQFTVAHELREPMRSMRILLQETLNDFDESEARDVLEMVSRRVASLERLLLGVMRYDELARRELSPAQVELRALAQGAFARMRASNEARNLEVVVGPLPQVNGDEALLTEAFVEAFNNVVQHAGPSPRAKVEGRVEGADALVWIEDEGQGVPTGREEDAFHLGQRLGPSDGTGVGLAIVRRIAERHDGDARIERAPGGGARLLLRLPLAGPSPRAPPPEALDTRTF